MIDSIKAPLYPLLLDCRAGINEKYNQEGMVVCFGYLIGVTILTISFIEHPIIVYATSALDIGNCVDFAILGSTGVSFNGATSTISIGSVGITPGTSISGDCVTEDGTTQVNTAPAVACATSMMSAYVSAVDLNCTNSTAPVDLSNSVLTPGVYCSGDGYFLITADTLILQGSSSDVWVFKASTSVTTGSATSIVLLGGALASNVFWQIGTTLQTGDSSLFIGTVLAGTSIILGPSSTLYGHAFAQAAVSCAGNNLVSTFLAGITQDPSAIPTISPSVSPSQDPTQAPSTVSTVSPSQQPSRASMSPSASPTMTPTFSPTRQPTMQPSKEPTKSPSQRPSAAPSFRPTSQPSSQPSTAPSFRPTSQPSSQPSTAPLFRPTSQPSSQPSIAPSLMAVTASQSASFTPVALICVCVFGSVGFLVTLAAVYNGIKKGRAREQLQTVMSSPPSFLLLSGAVDLEMVEIGVGDSKEELDV